MSLGNVTVEVNNLRYSNFDFGHDAPTTLEFGRMAPVHCKLVQAGTKSKVSTHGVTYFSPLSAPTYGKVFLHEYTQFVSMSSLFKQFPYFLANLSRINRPDQQAQIPGVLPRISAKMLFYILAKSSFSQYYYRSLDGGTSDVNDYWRLTSDSNVYQCWGLPANSHLDTNFRRNTSPNDEKYFNPSNYDFSWIKPNSDNDIKTMIRLTKNGSSLLDVFLTCGLKPSMDDSIEYDALHLFALYKAYYDIMEAPMTQYVNWEETALCRLLKYYDVNGSKLVYNIKNSNDPAFAEMHNLWVAFISELEDMFYTSNMDYISAHMPIDFADNNPLVNSSFLEQRSYNGNSNSNYEDFFASPTHSLNPLATVPGSSSQSTISVFSQLTDEWCKMAYYQINKRSQLGYALRKELKVRGYRDWCYDNDSQYINHHRSLLPITEFDNTSDTLNVNTKNGALLGDRAGKMTQKTASFASTHFARETGFLIHFVCVVPESRVCNGASEDALTTNVNEWYSILTDGFGYQATPYICIGVDDQCELLGTVMRASRTFGLVPRHFGKKISHNLKLGSFALRSQRNSTQSYYLDKILSDHEIAARQTDYDASTGDFKDKTGRQMPHEIPGAGPEWRQFAKYTYSNKYNRIFEFKGQDPKTPFQPTGNDYPVDNIFCLLTIKHNATARMLPTSMSWETIECEDDPKHTITIEK